MSTIQASIALEPASADAPADADAPAVAAEEPVLGSVISGDGTTIGYRRFGTGPALVLLHGSMSSGAHHTELARLLADTFTVYVGDRRGRGLSGPEPYQGTLSDNRLLGRPVPSLPPFRAE